MKSGLRLFPKTIRLIIALLITICTTPPVFGTFAQTITNPPESQPVELFNKLTPEEKIGQLF